MKTHTNPMRISEMIALSIALMLSCLLIVTTVHADTLTRQLEEGNSGTDVTSLQTYLAKDPTIYPQGLITGYFGSLTKSAVSNFQARNGIETVGRVGPVTMAALNAKMNIGGGVDVYAPRISGIAPTPSMNSAVVRWNTNEAAAGIVYYSTTWPSMSDSLTEATIGGTVATTDTALRLAHAVNITGLQANTAYYYVIYTRDASGNVQMTWPTTFRTTN